MKEVSPQTTDQATVRPPPTDRISEGVSKVYLRLGVHPSSQTFGIQGYLHPQEGRFRRTALALGRGLGDAL